MCQICDNVDRTLDKMSTSFVAFESVRRAQSFTPLLQKEQTPMLNQVERKIHRGPRPRTENEQSKEFFEIQESLGINDVQYGKLIGCSASSISTWRNNNNVPFTSYLAALNFKPQAKEPPPSKRNIFLVSIPDTQLKMFDTAMAMMNVTPVGIDV